MGFRFRRRIKIAPGIRVNLSKSGISTSLGGRGATLNLGRCGKRMSLGIPGSGMSYTKQIGSSKGSGSGKPVNPILAFFVGLAAVSAALYLIFNLG